MSTTRTRRRLALALTLSALLTLGTAAPAASAPRPPKPPALIVAGGETWFTHDVGWYVIVQGPVELQLRNGRTFTGMAWATIQPDDHTMPGPGECEGGMSFVTVEGTRARADLFLSSIGEICGHHVQLPESQVVTSYTGTTYVEESGIDRLVGREGFVDLRLAQDGSAHLFATAS
jgi:hypothetical protein